MEACYCTDEGFHSKCSEHNTVAACQNTTLASDARGIGGEAQGFTCLRLFCGNPSLSVSSTRPDTILPGCVNLCQARADLTLTGDDTSLLLPQTALQGRPVSPAAMFLCGRSHGGRAVELCRVLRFHYTHYSWCSCHTFSCRFSIVAGACCRFYSHSFLD